MPRNRCGVDLGAILEGIRPIDGPRTVAMYALEETLKGDLPLQVMRDDGAPAARAFLLILGKAGSDLYLATIDSRGASSRELPDVPIDAIREAVRAMPDGRPGDRTVERVMAAPHATAGILLAALTPDDALNCAFAHNPVLDTSEAAHMLKAYFTDVIASWTGKN